MDTGEASYGLFTHSRIRFPLWRCSDKTERQRVTCLARRTAEFHFLWPLHFLFSANNSGDFSTLKIARSWKTGGGTPILPWQNCYSNFVSKTWSQFWLRLERTTCFLKTRKFFLWDSMYFQWIFLCHFPLGLDFASGSPVIWPREPLYFTQLLQNWRDEVNTYCCQVRPVLWLPLLHYRGITTPPAVKPSHILYISNLKDGCVVL